VQPSVSIFGALEARKYRLIFVELTLLDRDIDPDDVLPHDAPSTDIQMSAYSIVRRFTGEGQRSKRRDEPDFRITHETIGEANREAVRSEQAVRMCLRNGVHVRCRACLNSVASQSLLGSDTPTIMYTAPLKKNISTRAGYLFG
jgi:hypothetical protein